MVHRRAYAFAFQQPQARRRLEPRRDARGNVVSPGLQMVMSDTFSLIQLKSYYFPVSAG